MSRPRPSPALCFHEAGHAAMMLRLGVRFRFATARSNGVNRGMVAYAEVTPAECRAENARPADFAGWGRGDLARKIITSMAGPAAEAAYRGRVNPHWAAGDARFVCGAADHLEGGPEGGDAWIRHGWKSCCRLVTEPDTWARVERLAGLLAVRPRVEYADAAFETRAANRPAPAAAARAAAARRVLADTWPPFWVARLEKRSPAEPSAA